MISTDTALEVMVLYLLLLFGIAQYAIRMKAKGKSIVSNPYVYALSICVYVSAWTFYGSIGKAASPGLGFLPIYIGPVLAMLLGWVMVRKMVRVSKEFRLTSISDFISFRYGRSYAVGAIVALASLIIVTPYVALQLIAISTSLNVMGGSHLIFSGERRMVVALLLGVFAAIFGARQLDPMDRHEGLMAAIAFESVVKLVAFLAAGLYVTYGLFGGYGEILDGLSKLIAANPEYAGLVQVDYVSWLSLTLVSFFAVLLLPRQFHVIAVENSDESHIRKAMWIFPLYLLLINLFVPAIAWAGLILDIPGPADAYIISIPYTHGHDILALLVFIGGVSAATAMILVSSVAVGTMMLNELEMPYLLRRIGAGRNLPSLILNARRLNILLVVALGYLYSLIGTYTSLADIGTVAFIAASQFAPAALGGLYWKKGSREGAIAGLVAGFCLWFYTTLVPVLAQAGQLPGSLLTSGPMGISFLRPTALFGMELDIWTHATFWTLLVNSSLYVLVSLISRPSADEATLTESFVSAHDSTAELLYAERRSIRLGTLDELESTLARYIGTEKARSMVDAELEMIGTTREMIDARHLLRLWGQFEKILTGSVGSSATKMIVQERVSVTPVREAAESTQPLYDLKPGSAYIIPEKAYEVFTDQIIHGVEGLCITRLDPEEVRRQWGFKETPIIKLSYEKGGNMYISPTNLPLLFVTIKSFVETSQNSIVLIDSIEYLTSENADVVPKRDVLDFVYQIEILSRKTRMVLSERPEFVCQGLSSDINPVKELIFVLGPLSAYLFEVFSMTMVSRLKEAVREEVVSEVNHMIANGELFDGSRSSHSDDAAEHAGACDPDMASAIGPGRSEIAVPPDLALNRREFFIAVRRLARVMKRHDPDFKLQAAVGDLMKSFGRSPYEVALVPGTTYVIEEEKPSRSLEIFSELVNHGMDGLCLSRYNPETLSDRYNMPISTVIWLTQKSESEYRSVDPTNFPRLSTVISEFLQRARYPVILLEGLGYLITQSNYETVLRFIQSQRDDIALRGAIMLVHIDPLSLDTKELHRLESEMEPMDA